MRGLHVKHAVQCEMWVPTQHLLQDLGNTRKTLFELNNSSLTAMLITSRHGPRRKFRSSAEVQLMLRCGTMYSIVGSAAIDTDRAGNSIPLPLLTDHYLATVSFSLPSNGLLATFHIAQGYYHNFLFFEGCACDVCDRPLLPSPWLGSLCDYSPTAPSAPSLRTVVLSGYLANSSTNSSLTNSSLTALLIPSQHRSRRKHRSSVSVKLLLSGGIIYFIVTCAAIGMGHAENNSSVNVYGPLLSKSNYIACGRYPTMGLHATIYLFLPRPLMCFEMGPPLWQEDGFDYCC
jgi:hypothetical protein